MNFFEWTTAPLRRKWRALVDRVRVEIGVQRDAPLVLAQADRILHEADR